MANFNVLLLSSVLLAIILLSILVSDVTGYQRRGSPRSQRSIGDMFKRFFNGRRKPSGFQGTAQAYQPYSFGSYGQASSSYPSYSSYPVYPNYGYGQNYATNNAIKAAGGYPKYYNYPIAASASQSYPNYAQAYASQAYSPQAYSSQAYAPQSAGSQQNIDVYQVLDQLIKSAGLSPQGDHQELQSKGDSSFTKTGTSPVFTFKKLYSFPFYLSSDNSSPDGSNMPFLKRNTRRMSPEDQLRYNLQQQQQLHQSQPQHQQQQERQQQQPNPQQSVLQSQSSQPQLQYSQPQPRQQQEPSLEQ